MPRPVACRIRTLIAKSLCETICRQETFLSRIPFQENIMDNDRAEGSMKTMKGRVKEGLGKALGDSKLETEGKMDKAEGKVQNAIGGMKDSLRKST
jgi:uncharacterized protein YjbJ (UPF0337 family)